MLPAGSEGCWGWGAGGKCVGSGGFGSMSATLAAMACSTRSRAALRVLRRTSGSALPNRWWDKKAMHSFCMPVAALLVWSRAARVAGGVFWADGLGDDAGIRLAGTCGWRPSGWRLICHGGGGMRMLGCASGQGCPCGERCGTGGGAIGASLAVSLGPCTGTG